MATRPFRKGGVFNGADHLIFEKASQLRKTMTDAENILWYHLKIGVNGLKFRRQHPLGIYIADFYCHKLKLVIELDGSIHQLTDIKEQDQQRQNDLERNGYTVIRFTNKQVMKQASDVMANIQLIVEKLTEQDALTNTLNKPPSGGLGVL